jgi:hypothetical protein
MHFLGTLFFVKEKKMSNIEKTIKEERRKENSCSLPFAWIHVNKYVTETKKRETEEKKT